MRKKGIPANQRNMDARASSVKEMLMFCNLCIFHIYCNQNLITMDYKKIDWAQLRKDKQQLIKQGMSSMVHLLDPFQDNAVSEGISELEVFGPSWADITRAALYMKNNLIKDNPWLGTDYLEVLETFTRYRVSPKLGHNTEVLADHCNMETIVLTGKFFYEDAGEEPKDVIWQAELKMTFLGVDSEVFVTPSDPLIKEFIKDEISKL